MNRLKKFQTRIVIIIMWIVCSVTSIGVGTVSAQVVDIHDPNLRALLEEDLGKAPGATIAVEDMESLTYLFGFDAQIRDLTGLEFATNLDTLWLSNNAISDLSPLTGLTRLQDLNLDSNAITDISPLAGLTNLSGLSLRSNAITDISVLAGLTNLSDLQLSSNAIADISMLAGLTNLTDLWLASNGIADISPLAGLTNLTHLYLLGNAIADISPLAGLTNLTNLHLGFNAIADISFLATLTNLTDLQLGYNPIADISPLANLTNLKELWLENNVIADLSPLVANIGLDRGDKVVVDDNPLSETSVNTHIPALEDRGVRVGSTHLFFPPIDKVRAGEIFKLNLHLDGFVLLDGWGLDIAFTPGVLAALQVDEGTYISLDNGCSQSIFEAGTIDNAAGRITGIGMELGADCFQVGEVLLSVTFQAGAAGKGELSLQNVDIRTLFGLDAEIGIHSLEIVVESDYDLNGDGVVNILDLVLVGQNFGGAHPQADVNNDGVVNIFDLITVAQHLGGASVPLAPGGLALQTLGIDATTVQEWIDLAHAADDGSFAFRRGIANLDELRAALQTLSPSTMPHRTELLANYPNPFNPETWIPYHLAHAADVTVTIYDSYGVMVRQLDLGYQQPGYYANRSSAAYWDGRNESGESVASGVYFYQLQAGHFYAMRKMVILK